MGGGEPRQRWKHAAMLVVDERLMQSLADAWLSDALFLLYERERHYYADDDCCVHVGQGRFDDSGQRSDDLRQHTRSLKWQSQVPVRPCCS